MHKKGVKKTHIVIKRIAFIMNDVESALFDRFLFQCYTDLRQTEVV